MDYWEIIWQDFQDGSNDAFEKIYNQFVDGLYRYGTKISSNEDLVKDAIQQLFIEIHTSRKRLSTPENIEFYLLKALKRIIIHKEIQERKFSEYKDAVKATFEIELDIENKIVSSEREQSKLQLLNEVISSLPNDKKELLYLKFYSGLTNEQIGKMTGIKADTVQKQIVRILRKLEVNFIDRFMELFVLCFRA